ncbi:MAG: protein kinase [Polyangiaceae bacterium]|nr:protein kinase [Polyangiaceae bacterium]MCW5791000.1 protein kinase [Polyangiaceae bacterium]
MTKAAIGAEYERLLELGRGGMGAAYLSRAVGALGFERLVVAKRLLPHLMEHPEAVRRFLAEAKVAAALHHSNIVGVHYAGQDEDGYFIVYDYVEGAALDELVERLALRGSPLPIPVMLRIALDALTGLHAAHTAKDHAGRPLNILHRDISPENLLVGRDGVTRVLDFGIAKSAVASVTTDQNYLLGKLMYMAPEYLSRAPVGPSLDVYALGVSLWVSLTGSSPWPGSSEAQLVMRIATEGVPRLSSFGLEVPPAVDELLARATALDPAERFADASEMLDAIERLSRDTGWLASHREVAALVERQIGVDLDRRRTHVSSLLSRRQLGEGGERQEPAGGPSAPRAAGVPQGEALGRAETLQHQASGGTETTPFELRSPPTSITASQLGAAPQGAGLRDAELQGAAARAHPGDSLRSDSLQRSGLSQRSESLQRGGLSQRSESLQSGPYVAQAHTGELQRSDSLQRSAQVPTGELPITLPSSNGAGVEPRQARRARLRWAVGAGVLLLGGGVLAASLTGHGSLGLQGSASAPSSGVELTEPSGAAAPATPTPAPQAAGGQAVPEVTPSQGDGVAAPGDASARSQGAEQAPSATQSSAPTPRPSPAAPQPKKARPDPAPSPRPQPAPEPGGITKTNPYR